MGKQFYDVDKGLQLDGGPVFLQGSGVPGSGGDSDAAVKGSVYLDTATGKSHLKATAGTGTDKWEVQASETFVLANSGSPTWRDPVLVHDATLYASVTAAQTAANVGDTVDGITIAANDRILLSNLTAGNENAYIVSGGTGAWIFTEDTNLATDGDATYVQDGTDAGKVYAYNGTAWVLINQASADELGFIRTFIGKTGAGAENPTYTNNNQITASNDLEGAVDEIDTFLGPDVTSGEYLTAAEQLNTSLDALQVGLTNTRKESVSANITTQTTVDSVNVDAVAAVKWIVYAQGNVEANAEKKFVAEILAAHNGHNVGATDDATVADFNVAGKLKLGNITGLDFDVDVTGVAGAQVMNLKVTSTMAADLKVIREVINF